jgi:DNA excision repair protein ERCC-6-like 2
MAGWISVRRCFIKLKVSYSYMRAVITSFDLAGRDIGLLDTLPWSCIIIDEVHRIKNATSKGAEAFSKFECLRRYGLTGTAIQNSYDELWAIANWTNPGLLGESQHWKKVISKPLRIGQSSKASEEERAHALVTLFQFPVILD